MPFKNKKILTAAALAGLTAIASALLVTLETLKREPSFCSVCHLPDGVTLHAEKNRIFGERPPRDLAALHRARQAGFVCSECHEGRTFGRRLAIRWEEAKNTTAYFLGTFKEPERLKAGLMPDETCESCHQSLPIKRDAFHGITAHRPKIKSPCIDCHASHTAGDPAYHFLDRERVKKACARCHRNIPGTFQADPSLGSKLERPVAPPR
ncbi:MAG: hypothetical protein HZA03_11120 [Nitrospinae bacterium]|nr:hypothetical protein [Nitrospinota bacterium]